MNNATQSSLGRYRLVKVLGQGAMGVVYEAVDTRLGRTVAIKTVLRSHLADENSAGEYASRFEREAQAAARLAHPNIVTVHDFGEHEDISYIVMEFVRGRELAEVFEAGQALPPAETIRIMRELLAALDYAHEQGVVHRDVKPANVMLDHAGHVKLTDFGVARVANTTQDRTMPGTLVGTPSYMAPEQVLGLAVGSRADIFAAGVILYQCLTGQRPFVGGGPFAVQRKIVQDDPLPPSRVAPQLPAAFDRVIARALAKQPEDRYPTAAAFAQALEQIGATPPQDSPRLAPDVAEPLLPGPKRATAAPPRAAPAPAPAAPPKAPPKAGRQPASPPPRAEPPQADAAGTLRRRTLPLFAGALVVLLALAAWLWFAGPPWRQPPMPAPAGAEIAPATPLAGPPARAEDATGAALVATPPVMPAGRGAEAREPAGAAAQAPAGAEAQMPAGAQTRTPADGGMQASTGTGTQAPARAGGEGQDGGGAEDAAPPAPAPAAVPAARPEPPAREALPSRATPTPRSQHGARTGADAASPEAAPQERGERREALGSRCGDLLQRMQLGEPLTPEQSQYFQSRCTR